MRDEHYKIRNLTIGIFLILLFSSMLLKADEEILTLESAIQMALSRNERAMAADEQVAAAESRVTKARAFFLPSLNITGTYTRRPNEVIRSVGGQQTVVQKYNALAGLMQLNLTIFDSHSLPTLLQANSERRAENYTAAESKRQLTFEVGNAFLSTLGVDQVLEASKHRFEYAKQALEAAKARYAAGLVSVNDVTRAELEYATAEMGITQVKGQLETAYLQLGYLLDDRGILQKKLIVPEFLLQAAANNPAAVDQLVSEAQDRRLDLGSLRWHAKAQHALVIEPVLKWLPSLAFIGQRRYTNEPGLTGRTWNWNLGLTATWSIFDGFTRNADYKERKALAVLADLDVKSAMRGVELDVRDALVSLTSQQASLKQAAVAYDVAKRNAAQIAELYRQGLATALQVADANVSLFEAEVELVRQRYGLAISYLNLEAALGLDPFGKEPTL
jgi:outer membrane protein TolC